MLDDAGEPVAAVEAYLAHLQALDRSPTTLRTYATSLKLWSSSSICSGWRWTRRGWSTSPGSWRGCGLQPTTWWCWRAAPPGCGPATVNKHLAALFSFYDYRARNGVPLAQALVAWRRVEPGWLPSRSCTTSAPAARWRPGRLRLRQPRRLPRTLAPTQVLALVEACGHLRDRFLLVLLAETAMRIGQALGLRHSDFVSHRRELRIVPRADNANGARAKTIEPPRSRSRRDWCGSTRAYMFDEYGELDSDYVFVNLFAEPYGPAAALPGRAPTGRPAAGPDRDRLHPHMLRHSRATDLLRHGVGVDVVARLLTHRSSTTTSQTYIHLDAADLRAELVRTGAWRHEEGSS